MEPNVITYLENILADLQWEMKLEMDELVKKDVAKKIGDTYNMLKYFKNLTNEEQEKLWNTSLLDS